MRGRAGPFKKRPGRPVSLKGEEGVGPPRGGGQAMLMVGAVPRRAERGGWRFPRGARRGWPVPLRARLLPPCRRRREESVCEGEGVQSPPSRWGGEGRGGGAGRDHCPERGVRGGPAGGVSRGQYHSRGGARATGGTIPLSGLRDAAGGGRGGGRMVWGKRGGGGRAGGAGERGCHGRYHVCGKEGGGGGAGGQWSLCVFAGGGRTRRRRGETLRRPLPPGAERSLGPRPSPTARR